MRRWAYPALSFLTGAAVTIFEFAAPNLFRAYFGQTIYVWANVIGVILGALAVGYALGGRWADRTASPAPLFGIIGFAGLYGALVGVLGPDVSLWLAGPDEYTQDAALRAFWVESLAASLVLFAPPLIALGMATPFLVQRSSRYWPVGRSAGLVFAISTAGSIAGIYLTTYVLLDFLGVRLAIGVSAGLLLAISAAGFLLTRGGRLAAAPAAALVLVPFSAPAPWADLPPEGSRLVLALESPYQLVRVVDRPDGARWLAFDEGMGTYHSIDLDPETGLTGAYYDAFVHLPEWAGGEGTRRICIVGNAAGTMAELLHRHNDASLLEIDGVEIDPSVTEAARRAMGLDGKALPALAVHHADGRTFLRGRPEGHYDAIVLDAYARQVSVPAALATKEFFALAKSRLRPGGLFVANLGALRPGGPLVRVLANTLAAGFGTPVFRAPMEDQLNVLLIAARDAAPRPPPAGTPLGVHSSFGRHVPDGMVLTDDHAPVERLTAQDLLHE